ncbi:hypothetical protein BRD17_08555 [Halobacteriales archaeon SW_7_68_16]|nr:MAG: hypothetical protein BRD17_08555 [Halobacteriales archaeon SW_7_68_16]
MVFFEERALVVGHRLRGEATAPIRPLVGGRPELRGVGPLSDGGGTGSVVVAALGRERWFGSSLDRQSAPTVVSDVVTAVDVRVRIVDADRGSLRGLSRSGVGPPATDDQPPNR